jgi:hypothetical protein
MLSVSEFTTLFDCMTIAQRLACVEGSTLEILGVSAGLWLNTAASDSDSLWALSARRDRGTRLGLWSR